MIEKILARKPQLVILDEAHYIKNPGIKRTETLLPVIKQFKRVILLTGTPAFARPKELFNLLQALRPDIFTKLKDFGNRYCDPKLSRWGGGRDFDGASHTRELRYILQNTVMIRRLKKDVLSELPPKRRQKVEVNTDPTIVAAIQKLLSKNDYSGAVGELMNQAYGPETDLDNQIGEMQRGTKGEAMATIMSCYSLTGKAKLKGIKEYLKDFIENDIKFLIFAHHLEILDGIEEEVRIQGAQYIRIDGTVNPKIRQDRVDAFQENEDIKVAILSLTACNVGINLTAASTVIFAEMNWTPAVMIQAEDRVHRLGQKEKMSINCHYIYGEDTLDSLMFDKLEVKLAIVSAVIDGEESLNAEKLQKNGNDLMLSEDDEEREVKTQKLSKEAAYELTGIKKTPQKTPTILSYFQSTKKVEAPFRMSTKASLEEVKEISIAETRSESFKGAVGEQAKPDFFEDDDLLDEFVEQMLQESKKATPIKAETGNYATNVPKRDLQSSKLFDEEERIFKSQIHSLATTPLNVDKSRSLQSTLEKKKTGGFLFTKEMTPLTDRKLLFPTTAESSPAKLSNQPNQQPVVNSIKNVLFDCEATKRARPEEDQLKPLKTKQEKTVWSKEEDDDFFGIAKKVRGVAGQKKI